MCDGSDPPPDALVAEGNSFSSGLLNLGIGLAMALVVVAIIGGVVLTDNRLKELVLRRR